jgi:hypothetical protein
VVSGGTTIGQNVSSLPLPMWQAEEPHRSETDHHGDVPGGTGGRRGRGWRGGTGAPLPACPGTVVVVSGRRQWLQGRDCGGIRRAPVTDRPAPATVAAARFAVRRCA